MLFFLMRRHPQTSTRRDTLFPYMTLVRSAQPSVKQGDVEAGIANKLFYLGIFPRVRKVERRGRVAVDAVLPIRIPSAKINRNGIGKRNPCFSICAEIAVGIAFVAAQTFIEVGNADRKSVV